MGSGRSRTDSEVERWNISEQIEQLKLKQGSIPISGRYHTNRSIHDDYSVMETVLGSGLNGEVVLAKKPENQSQAFAVKSFSTKGLSAKRKELLQNEVEVFLCMDHPHIIRLFDVYESDESLYLVMERMEGGELFERLEDQYCFTEDQAARAVYQMLLALNYIHSHGIVHRDLKLENFLYDWNDRDHLKLIDFGFSKVCRGEETDNSCGTLPYLAPEVLSRTLGGQSDTESDMWSLGVIAFVLLSGYMPFSGDDDAIRSSIMSASYKWKPHRWDHISSDARSFVQDLLKVKPTERLSANLGLEHAWMRGVANDDCVSTSVIEGFRHFRNSSKMRRCILQMIAWSLSNEERARVRQFFVKMDATRQGTITLQELSDVLTMQFGVSNEETLAIFASMDSNKDQEIHYSDFLAAMVSTPRLSLNDDLLKAAFKKFDTDSSGYITPENLSEVLGDTYEGDAVSNLLDEADLLKDGRISYAEFAAFMRGEELNAAEIFDRQLTSQSTCSELDQDSPNEPISSISKDSMESQHYFELTKVSL